jgi:hypothetical protein
MRKVPNYNTLKPISKAAAFKLWKSNSETPFYVSNTAIPENIRTQFLVTIVPVDDADHYDTLQGGFREFIEEYAEWLAMEETYSDHDFLPEVSHVQDTMLYLVAR